jgi:PhzF family phenazine biosynthesis protein
MNPIAPALQVIVVDAFADVPFTGNPAAVCVLPSPASASWMQNLAREMNLSETAFLVRESDAFELRWFTPTTEVDLCGHATLASAHALWTEGHASPNDALSFRTRSGVLTARRQDDWIELDFPSQPAMPCEAAVDLLPSLGVTAARYVGRNESDYLVELETETDVRSVAPDFARLGRCSTRGVIVTSRADASARYDFVSRCFAPACGIDEDPVTGSAHCCLGPYWRDRLGRDALTGYQASARGGIVKVSAPANSDRVALRGRAVTVLRGELTREARTG